MLFLKLCQICPDKTGDLLHRFQPAIYQRNWLTGLPLTPPYPDLGKTQATGVYTLTPPPIIHLNARLIIYTDGSATAGTLNGGAGKVVTEGGPATPTTLLTKQQRGAAITSSYDEEKAAMRMALEWLLPSHAAAANRFLKRFRAAPPTLQT